MMHRKNITLSLLLLFCSISLLSAQKLSLKVGLNMGASKLYHDIDYRSTVANNLFAYTQELFAHEGIDYTWEQFAKSNKLNKSFLQPRFGFSAHMTYSNWPAFAIVDAMSSTSSYEKMAYSATVGMGKDFPIGDNTGMFLTALGGYKFVLMDRGFGAKTLVNGVGDRSLRQNLQTIFNPQQPLGTNKGNLFTLRLGVGKTFGEMENMSAGVEAYGELDLTDRIKRNTRMTNVGAQIYMRFNIFGNKDDYMPNPQAAGGRK